MAAIDHDLLNIELQNAGNDAFYRVSEMAIESLEHETRTWR